MSISLSARDIKGRTSLTKPVMSFELMGRQKCNLITWDCCLVVEYYVRIVVTQVRFLAIPSFGSCCDLADRGCWTPVLVLPGCLRVLSCCLRVLLCCLASIVPRIHEQACQQGSIGKERETGSRAQNNHRTQFSQRSNHCVKHHFPSRLGCAFLHAKASSLHGKPLGFGPVAAS